MICAPTLDQISLFWRRFREKPVSTLSHAARANIPEERLRLSEKNMRKNKILQSLR
jgi:hypothetical protein